MGNEINDFINVYGFVPFSNTKAKYYKENGEELHTGVITYEIETKTPLFIPNTSNSEFYEKDEHKEYDFFSYNNLENKTDYSKYYEPVIPGSELRGMVRSIYETITNSCMSVLNDNIRPVKRTGEIFSGALIHKVKDKYILEKADVCLYQKLKPEAIHKKPKDRKSGDFQKTFMEKECKEGGKVFFEKIDRGNKGLPITRELYNKEIGELKEGYIIRGEGGIKKHNAHIMMQKHSTDCRIVELDRSDIDNLKDIIDSYQNQPNQDNFYNDYKKSLDEFLKGEGNEYFPVYYSIVKSASTENKYIVYLSPASITKEISRRKLQDAAGEYLACSTVENRCPACDLFGMVGRNNKESRTSKLRFSDAFILNKADNKEYYDKPVILPELSSPKVGNMEFYLKKPDDANFWTYDYYVDKNSNIKLYSPTLSGRKYYWNQPDMTYPRNVEKNIRNVTIRAVKKHNKFEGKVFFENISTKQLNQILWILNCGSRNKDENDMVFKLGSAKPLGFGSVLLTVKDIKERKIIAANEKLVDGEYIKLIYSNKSKTDYRNIKTYEECEFYCGENDEIKKSFMNLTSFEKMCGYRISYPLTKEQISDFDKKGYVSEGYKWFTNNHTSKGFLQNRVQNKLNAVLPDAKDIFNSNIIIGHVIDYIDNKKVKIKTQENRTITLHVCVFKDAFNGHIDLKKQFPIGTKIKVRDKGKGSNGYVNYEYIS